MNRIKIIGLIACCVILASCAAPTPKADNAPKADEAPKADKVDKANKIDIYAGQSLPYGLVYGMSKDDVTTVLNKETGGTPKIQGQNLIWSGIGGEKPRIVVVFAALFKDDKLMAFEMVNYGQKTDEVYKQIDAGFNNMFNGLNKKHTLKSSKITEFQRAALFETSNGHYMLLLLQTDDKNNVYATRLMHREKLPENSPKSP